MYHDDNDQTLLISPQILGGAYPVITYTSHGSFWNAEDVSEYVDGDTDEEGAWKEFGAALHTFSLIVG
ncbi:MAG: hypothetical protein ACI8W8_004307 [Rhodothermales bacterium]|jgi:hypothetical protein